MFPPIQNRYAVENRKEEVHRGLQNNMAAWQVTNMRDGRSKYQHFPHHHWPLTHSLCHNHFIADQPVLIRASVVEFELKSIAALSTSLTITSAPTKCLQASFSPNQHSLSASAEWQSVIPLQHSLLSTTAGVSEEASPFEPLLFVSKNIAETIMRLCFVFFLQGWLQWSTSNGKKNDCHQHAAPASETFIPVKHNQVFKAGLKMQAQHFCCYWSYC